MENGPVSNRLVNEIRSGLRIVFSQSEDGSRLCDHKHLPVGDMGAGPGQSENGSGLKIFLNQPVDGISLKRLGGGWSWFIE